MGCPEIDVDLWADEILVDPYPTYAHLRELGPVLYTSKWDAYVLPRYDEVRHVLQDWETFTSAKGVGMSPTMNLRSGHGILTTDPPLHDTRRRVLNAQLVPREIERHRAFITETAEQMVADVVARGSFDAVAELAAPFSVKVVADLVGLPDDQRAHLIERASAAFNTFGPDNELSICSRGLLDNLFDQVKHQLTPDMLAPDGWGVEIFDAGRRGDVAPEACPGLMLAYLWAGMDTTVNGIGSAISLFADHPEQWELLRSDRDLLGATVNEVLRIEPPVQRFTRCTTRATTLAGVALPEGARVAVLFGSANRDERRFPDPDRFDVTRNPTDHLSFGRGIHRCVGAGLAQEEMKAVLNSLADRVALFNVVDRAWRRNNALHGLERLDIEAVPRMKARWFVLAAFAVAAACGGDDAGPVQPLAVDVPATVVGVLDISVEEGPVGADDLSEVNFGSVETDAGPVLIEVWADVVRAAGLSRDELVGGGRFRVELSERAAYSTTAAPSYRVATLTPAP